MAAAEAFFGDLFVFLAAFAFLALLVFLAFFTFLPFVLLFFLLFLPFVAMTPPSRGSEAGRLQRNTPIGKVQT